MADLGFSPGGAPTPKVGVLIYYFCRKLHENERIWTPGGRASLAPPLGSANEYYDPLTTRSVRTNINFFFSSFGSNQYLLKAINFFSRGLLVVNGAQCIYFVFWSGIFNMFLYPFSCALLYARHVPQLCKSIF